jgi:hypothetical protein
VQALVNVAAAQALCVVVCVAQRGERGGKLVVVVVWMMGHKQWHGAKANAAHRGWRCGRSHDAAAPPPLLLLPST